MDRSERAERRGGDEEERPGGEAVPLTRLRAFLRRPDVENLKDITLDLQGTLSMIPHGFTRLKSLEKLVLVNGRIARISSLDSCQSLRTLNLSNNRITRISGLSNNNELRCLMLDSNPIAHIFAEDFAGLAELRQLYLCGTCVLNLWSTVAALKHLYSLRELYLCKEYHPLIQNKVYERERLDEIEMEAETIVDMVVRRIGDFSFVGLERLSSSFRDLSGSLTDTLSGRLSPLAHWQGALGERVGEYWTRLGVPPLQDLTRRIRDLGSRLNIQELEVFGQTLEGLTVEDSMNYLHTLRGNLSGMAENGTVTVAQLISAVQDVINENTTDFGLDQQSSTDDEEDEGFIFPLDEEDENRQNQVLADVVAAAAGAGPGPGGDRHLAGAQVAQLTSPICVQRHYQDFMVHNLPQLQVLDGRTLDDTWREKAAEVYHTAFEDVANGLSSRKQIVDCLLARELGASMPARKTGVNLATRRSCDPSCFGEQVCGSLVSSFEKPSETLLTAHSVCFPVLGALYLKRLLTLLKYLKPRQFEYNPTIPSMLVYGTPSGENVVLNTRTLEQYGPIFTGSRRSVLGLCWLRRSPNMFVSGNSDGTMQLFDVDRFKREKDPLVTNFDNASDLTSLHVNCQDQYCLTSGYFPRVHLYDLAQGRLLNTFHDLHEKFINVLKFSNCSPHLFATSSFDRSIKLWDLRQPIRAGKPVFTRRSVRGNVMVCFSPDDKYLLSSAVDNEVRQYLTVDGRLHLHLDITKLHSKINYTRSYYMNKGKYIIVGTCEESVVRVFDSEHGKFLRDVPLTYNEFVDKRIYCQSLRANPFQPFTFGALIADAIGSSELVEVSLLKNSSFSLDSGA